MTKTGIIRLFGTALLASLLSACATQVPQPGPADQAEEPASVEPWDGDGMDIPLDGSSLEAFDASLARVEAHTNPENYTTLLNAIEYLLVYDLSAKRDRARLVANLDGLTPNEVIAKVNWGKSPSGESPSSGKAPDSTIEL